VRRIETFEIFGFGKKAGVPILPTGKLTVWRVPIEIEKLKLSIKILNSTLEPFDFYVVAYKSGLKPKTNKEFVYIIKEKNNEDSWDYSLDRIKKMASRDNKKVEYMGDVDLSPEVIEKYKMEKTAKKYNI
jgi:hypothetical protein